MATASLEEVRRAISEKGFWTLQDADIGKRVDQIVKHGYHLKTEEGLDLCRVAILKNQLVSNVIVSFLPRAVLGYYKFYGQTKHHHCVVNRTTPDMQVLEVQLWSSGSQWIFDAGSQLHALNAQDAPNGLLAIPPDRLQLPGITPTPMEMPNGGLALVDARLGFQILKGKVAKLGYMSPDEVRHWAKMRLPESLQSKVKDMETETIRMNFVFVGPKPEDSFDGR